MENHINYSTAQRNFANVLMTLHNTNKTDGMEDFGLLMLTTGCVIGDLNLVSTAMENYPESADPNRPITPKIMNILSQLKLIELEILQRPESPTGVDEIIVSND